MTRSFIIDLRTVCADKKSSSILRALAYDILSSEYVTVGSFFRNLSDSDMDEVERIVEQSMRAEEEEDEESQDLKDLIILVMLLAQSEGGICTSADDLQGYTGVFRLLTTITRLDRLGLTNAVYENFSLLEDAMDLVVATRKEQEDD